MRRIGTTVLALTLMAAPAAAQGHGQHGQQAEGQGMHGMQGMHAGMQCAMMGGAGPAAILEHGEHLGLTADQVSRLEALRDRASMTARPHMEQAMAAHRQAAAAISADRPDLAAYEAALRAAADHAIQGHTAMAGIAVAARATLTADQRQQLKTMMAEMGEGAGMSCMMDMMGMMGGHDQHGG